MGSKQHIINQCDFNNSVAKIKNMQPFQMILDYERDELCNNSGIQIDHYHQFLAYNLMDEGMLSCNEHETEVIKLIKNSAKDYDAYSALRYICAFSLRGCSADHPEHICLWIADYFQGILTFRPNFFLARQVAVFKEKGSLPHYLADWIILYIKGQISPPPKSKGVHKQRDYRRNTYINQIIQTLANDGFRPNRNIEKLKNKFSACDVVQTALSQEGCNMSYQKIAKIWANR